MMSKMYCRLPCHGHEYPPDHRVDVDLWHIVSRLTTNFLSYIRVKFLKLAHILWRDNLVPMEFFVGLPVLVIVFESECRTWEFDAMFSFEPFATSLTLPTRTEFECCPPNVPGLLDALEPSVVGGWLASFDTKLIIVFDFATARSFSPSFSSCLILLYMVWELLIGLKWLQENIEKNSWCWTHEEDDLTHHGWNCLSSIGLRFGFRCRHIWFWILGSKLILSNNQPNATLSVRDTCLIVRIHETICCVFLQRRGQFLFLDVMTWLFSFAILVMSKYPFSQIWCRIFSWFHWSLRVFFESVLFFLIFLVSDTFSHLFTHLFQTLFLSPCSVSPFFNKPSILHIFNWDFLINLKKNFGCCCSIF